MTLSSLIGIYFICSVIGTYLLSCTFALSKQLPDRRKGDRRRNIRESSVDRRITYREKLVS